MRVSVIVRVRALLVIACVRDGVIVLAIAIGPVNVLDRVLARVRVIVLAVSLVLFLCVLWLLFV